MYDIRRPSTETTEEQEGTRGHEKEEMNNNPYELVFGDRRRRANAPGPKSVVASCAPGICQDGGLSAYPPDSSIPSRKLQRLRKNLMDWDTHHVVEIGCDTIREVDQAGTCIDCLHVPTPTHDIYHAERSVADKVCFRWMICGVRVKEGGEI